MTRFAFDNNVASSPESGAKTSHEEVVEAKFCVRSVHLLILSICAQVFWAAFDELPNYLKIRLVQYLWSSFDVPDELWYFSSDNSHLAPMFMVTSTTSQHNTDAIMVSISPEECSITIPKYTTIASATRQLYLFLAMI